MRLVERVSTVVTEDMPVDPEAHDLQVWFVAHAQRKCVPLMPEPVCV